MDAQALTFGRYRLLDLIGTGGMAEVFLAKLEGIEGFERRLAIKRILPHFSKNESFVQMFIDEARLVGHFSHPNIVQIYDFGKIDDCYYISMEYVEGINVADILTRYKLEGRSIPPEVIVEIGLQVCRGIDYAHKETDEQGQPLGIIHRDLTPHNLLVSRKGVVKITDFGIAKASMNTHMTQAGMIKGKVPYMSPEQATGMQLTHVSDIFAFGIVMYEMCTLRRLFEGENDFTILRKVQEARIPSIREQNPEIPEELERIIRKALARERSERYQWAGEMELELTRLKFSLGPRYQHFSLAAFVAEFMSRPPLHQASRPAAPPPPSSPPAAPEDEVEESLSAIAADLSALSNPLMLARGGAAGETGEAPPEDRPTQLLVTDADGNPTLPEDVQLALKRSALSELGKPKSSSRVAGADDPRSARSSAGDEGRADSKNLAPARSGAPAPAAARGPEPGMPAPAVEAQRREVSDPGAPPPPPPVAVQAAGPAAASSRPVAATPSTPNRSAPGSREKSGGSSSVASPPPRRGRMAALAVGVALLAALVVWLLIPSTGSLVVQYTPEDAEILLNGELVASQSPFVREGMPEGEAVRIVVRRAGYREFSRELTIQAGIRAVLPVSLVRIPASGPLEPASSSPENPASPQSTPAGTPGTPQDAAPGDAEPSSTTTASSSAPDAG